MGPAPPFTFGTTPILNTEKRWEHTQSRSSLFLKGKIITPPNPYQNKRKKREYLSNYNSTENVSHTCVFLFDL